MGWIAAKIQFICGCGVRLAPETLSLVREAPHARVGGSNSSNRRLSCAASGSVRSCQAERVAACQALSLARAGRTPASPRTVQACDRTKRKPGEGKKTWVSRMNAKQTSARLRRPGPPPMKADFKLHGQPYPKITELPLPAATVLWALVKSSHDRDWWASCCRGRERCAKPS
jgi:hypothetical protein